MHIAFYILFRCCLCLLNILCTIQLYIYFAICKKSKTEDDQTEKYSESSELFFIIQITEEKSVNVNVRVNKRRGE